MITTGPMPAVTHSSAYRPPLLQLTTRNSEFAWGPRARRAGYCSVVAAVVLVVLVLVVNRTVPPNTRGSLAFFGQLFKRHRPRVMYPRSSCRLVFTNVKECWIRLDQRLPDHEIPCLG